MKKMQEISGAELEVMQILWKYNRAMKVQEVWEALQSDKWKYRTVGTLLLRMEAKGAVTSEKIGKANLYTPVLDKDEYLQSQTKNFIQKLYNGSVKELAVSLLRNHTLSDQDIADIRKEFDL